MTVQGHALLSFSKKWGKTMAAGDLREWRGYDLEKRKNKFRRAFNRGEITTAEEIPVIAATPTYFLFGSADKPADYFDEPARMVAYQEAKLRAAPARGR